MKDFVIPASGFTNPLASQGDCMAVPRQRGNHTVLYRDGATH